MISDAEYEQLHAQYEARIERHNDEIEEHKETFRLLKAAEAERDAAHEGLVRAATEVINVSLARDAALARVAELEQALRPFAKMPSSSSMIGTSTVTFPIRLIAAARAVLPDRNEAA